MNRKELLKNIRIDILSKDSLRISSKDFDFAYNQPDSIVKEEFKGMYRNFGGLQSNYIDDKESHEKLEMLLIEFAEDIFKLINKEL
jgi:hypothetical protein